MRPADYIRAAILGVLMTGVIASLWLQLNVPVSRVLLIIVLFMIAFEISIPFILRKKHNGFG